MACRPTYIGRVCFFVLFIMSASQVGRAGDLSSVVEDKQLVISLAVPVAVYPDPKSYSLLFSKSAEAELRFSADRNLYMQPEDGAGSGMVRAWREFVYAKLLTVYPTPREDGADYCIGLDCPQSFNDPANDGKAVTKLISKETLRFMRQKVPQIEQILATLKLDVADSASKDDPSPVFKNMNQITELKNQNEDDKKGLSLQSRMRVRVNEGDITLVTETRATYRKASSYFRVNLRKPSDTTFGFKYVLGVNTHLQFERETKYNPSVNSAYDDTPHGRMSQNALRLVFLF